MFSRAQLFKSTVNYLTTMFLSVPNSNRDRKWTDCIRVAAALIEQDLLAALMRSCDCTNDTNIPAFFN